MQGAAMQLRGWSAAVDVLKLTGGYLYYCGKNDCDPD
jgi:hypothetical protein